MSSDAVMDSPRLNTSTHKPSEIKTKKYINPSATTKMSPHTHNMTNNYIIHTHELKDKDLQYTHILQNNIQSTHVTQWDQ